MKCTPIHVGVIVLMAIAWIIMMAGVAGVDDKIKNASDDDLRPMWWGVWFEFFVLILNVVALFMGAENWYVALCVFSGSVSTYVMPHAELWLRLDKGPAKDAAQAAAGGTIMCIMVNWVMILLLGNSDFRKHLVGKVCCELAICTNAGLV